ncbi:Similar to Tex9: Testis-expressed protein 9 (Mus musculus) [Cotesia congregata]|uniref:Similar to Tex9: Testis-expressed protein 9 (Mus musculus) n=1 Tax=Cotesia congregata TaxID=51543 RepID=A0A8J2HI57_COTCN|nr:Similar to Tex9: Testis-expressed protein 9 (Mus musculus) [Cotesia congregata]
MADDLLIKEKEFRRINKELESKTHKLLEEIDTVINNNHKNNFETEIVKFRTQSAFNFFNTEYKLNRSLEDNEKLKNSLKSSKNEERNNVNKIRKLEDHIKVITKNNERLRQELVQAFKKQSLLVDNLKKQKAYLETSRQVELTRDDFLKIIKAYIVG